MTAGTARTGPGARQARAATSAQTAQAPRRPDLVLAVMMRVSRADLAGADPAPVGDTSSPSPV